MAGLLNKIFKSKNEKEMIKINKVVDQIDALSEKYEKYTNEELRACTQEFKERYKQTQNIDELLVEAFAVVREASTRVLNMRHFKVQLAGGIVLHQGRIAEMKTGEGKTLVATLPAYLNALTGKGMHIVTVNDYLARRDAEWMGKIYKFLGLTVGVVVSQMSQDDKKKAYACDIVYATNNELGFDYLRDNMVVRKEDRVQRDLEFAIVDEVDNILIDEARTPLIISGDSGQTSELYIRANQFAKRLAPEVKDEKGNYVSGDYIVEAKEKTIRLSDTGVEKAEQFFNVENLGDIENQEIVHYINNAMKANVMMHKDKDYVLQDGEIIIVDEFTGRLMIGRRYSDGLHQAIEAKENVKIKNESQTLATITFQNYFRLYNKLSGMTGTAKTEEHEFQDIYHLDVVELPTNLPIQRKDENDKLFTVVKGKYNAIIADVEDCYKRMQPVLVGTVTVEKSELIAGMLAKKKIPCNVLNAKNHAREAEIVAQAGKAGAVTIATNMAGRGTDIMLGGNPEYMAIDKLRRDGYSGEILAQVTSHAPTTDEAIIAAKAEYKKYYEIYKKQTDEEKKEVIAVGGLRIIGTERHESRRIDNQLRGRSGRQGDPGSSVFYLSMEDDILKIFGGEQMLNVAQRFNFSEEDVIENKIMSRQIEKAQARVEDRNFSARKYVLSYDNVMNQQRDLIYKERNKVLNDETNIHEQILDMMSDVLEEIIEKHADTTLDVAKWDYISFNSAIEEMFLPAGSNVVTPQLCASADIFDIKEKIYKIIVDAYEEKKAKAIEDGLDFDEIEKTAMLKIVDRKWIEHIDNMDKLKEAAGLRAYGQKDPVVVFRQEGLDMFNEMADSIRYDVARVLSKAIFTRQVVRESTGRIRGMDDSKKNVKAHNETIVRKEKKIGRNDPCPCGSGKKYKNCCGQ